MLREERNIVLFLCGEYNVLLFNNINNDDDILNSPYKCGSQLC